MTRNILLHIVIVLAWLPATALIFVGCLLSLLISGLASMLVWAQNRVTTSPYHCAQNIIDFKKASLARRGGLSTYSNPKEEGFIEDGSKPNE